MAAGVLYDAEASRELGFQGSGQRLAAGGVAGQRRLPGVWTISPPEFLDYVPSSFIDQR